MLDLTHEPSVSDVSWDAVELSARIPGDMPDFLETQRADARSRARPAGLSPLLFARQGNFALR